MKLFSGFFLALMVFTATADDYSISWKPTISDAALHADGERYLTTAIHYPNGSSLVMVDPDRAIMKQKASGDCHLDRLSLNLRKTVWETRNTNGNRVDGIVQRWYVYRGKIRGTTDLRESQLQDGSLELTFRNYVDDTEISASFEIPGGQLLDGLNSWEVNAGSPHLKLVVHGTADVPHGSSTYFHIRRDNDAVLAVDLRAYRKIGQLPTTKP